MFAMVFFGRGSCAEGGRMSYICRLRVGTSGTGRRREPQNERCTYPGRHARKAPGYLDVNNLPRVMMLRSRTPRPPAGYRTFDLVGTHVQASILYAPLDRNGNNSLGVRLLRTNVGQLPPRTSAPGHLPHPRKS